MKPQVFSYMVDFTKAKCEVTNITLPNMPIKLKAKKISRALIGIHQKLTKQQRNKFILKYGEDKEILIEIDTNELNDISTIFLSRNGSFPTYPFAAIKPNYTIVETTMNHFETHLLSHLTAYMQAFKAEESND